MACLELQHFSITTNAVAPHFFLALRVIFLRTKKILKPATVTLWSGKYERVNIAATWATLPVIALGLSSFHIIVQTHCIPYDDPWNSSSTETVITTLAPSGLQALL